MPKGVTPKFHIGDWVHVIGTVSFLYDQHRQREVHRMECKVPWDGQIVGASLKRTGKLGVLEPGDEFESTTYYFAGGGKSVLVWLVRRGILNRPQLVVEDDLQSLALTCPARELPWKWVGEQPSWTENSRRWARHDAAKIPRDVQGRWTK